MFLAKRTQICAVALILGAAVAAHAQDISRDSSQESAAESAPDVATDPRGNQAPAGSASNDNGRPWVVGLAGQFDDESNSSLLTMFNLAAADSTWFSLTAGQSDAPASGANVEATTLEAAVDHQFGLVGLSISGGTWGDSSSLESTDWRGSIYFRTDRFRVGLERQRRDIDIHFTITGLLGRTDARVANLTGDGTGLSFRVDLTPRWQLFGSWMDFDYSRNLTLLPLVDRLNFLSTSALTLANSFTDEATTLGLEWSVGDKSLSVSVSQDRSAVDRTQFKSVNAAFLFPAQRRMDIELNIGRGQSDFANSGLYGGVLLLIYGGG